MKEGAFLSAAQVWQPQSEQKMFVPQCPQQATRLMATGEERRASVQERGSLDGGVSGVGTLVSTGVAGFISAEGMSALVESLGGRTSHSALASACPPDIHSWLFMVP